MNDELMDVLKVMADKRMEKTLGRIFNEDKEYLKMSETIIGMEKTYDSLEVDSNIKEIIDKLLAERDGMNMEKVSLAYWAGMMDAIAILRDMDIITL